MQLDGAENALSDVALDELSRTGLSGTRSRSVAEWRPPGQARPVRQVSERWNGRVRRPTRSTVVRAPARTRRCRFRFPASDL